MLQRSASHWEVIILIITCRNTCLEHLQLSATDCFISSISLSGRTHIVHTGVTLVWRGGGEELQERGFHETTEVTFAPLSEEVLRSYVASGEPL